MSDGFYRAFEEKHRGSRELIKSRLRAYLPFVEPLAELDKGAQTIDLGCGRGEWLELMTEVGFKSHGVDLDEGMLSGCVELGLSVDKGDAIAFLAALPSESQAIVSVFHVVEHISFEQLQTVVSEALRVLKPGGLLIMETPNPENIVVATCNFYLDPTHQRPIPPQLLSFLPEYYGFARVKTVRLQESKELMQSTSLTLRDVLDGVSPDYAVIAQKAAAADVFHRIDPAFEDEYGLSLATLAARYTAQLDTKAQQAAAKAGHAEAQAQQTVVRAQHAEAQAQQAIQAMVNSCSWRITAPLRWFWLQARMLRDQGVSTRTKALVKKVMRSAVRSCLDFLEARPVARVRLVTLTRRLGLYQLLRGVFSRLSSNLNSANMSAEQQAQAQLPNELKLLLKRVIFKRHWQKQWVTETRRKILYVDISHLVQKDLKTGIQRVTRSIVTALMNNPPADYQVKPVFATATSHGYLHANRYAQQLAGVLGEKQEDEPIDPQPGDIFLGLDFVVGVVVAQQRYLKWMHNRGVRMYFVVYDLLPTKLPQCFPEGTEAWHRQWLQTIAKFDGAICISRAVKDDLDAWLRTSGSQRHRPFDTGWFHLGADVENSLPTKGIPKVAGEFINKLAALPSFLMVGTVEPRKGHTQTLQAFELLWEQGAQINLVIVGNQGWMVEELSKRLHKHPELNNRLFWLQEISDEYLEQIYAVSTCLIAASEGEGFGLPLIEAAKHKLPIIARGIPEFREVAGDHADYFSGLAPASLASAVEHWLAVYANNGVPKSEGMPWITWSQSADQLLEYILLNSTNRQSNAYLNHSRNSLC